MLLPSEVGVKAKAEGCLGKINAEGLQRVGDSYVNDAYRESDVTLKVDVQGGVGEINLEVVWEVSGDLASGGRRDGGSILETHQ